METTKKPTIPTWLLCEEHLKKGQVVPVPNGPVYIDAKKVEHPLCQFHYQETLDKEVVFEGLEKLRAARLKELSQ